MKHKEDVTDKTPLWKWLVFLLVALAMPLLFMNYRAQQTEQVIAETNN